MTPELLQITVVALLGILSVATTVIGFFIARTLRKVDANQTILFERMTDQGEKLAELRGEHRARLAGGTP